VTSNEEDVIESEFRLDWDELSNLFVPDMDNVWFTISINKNTDKIVGVKIRNKLGDALHLDRDTKVVDDQKQTFEKDSESASFSKEERVQECEDLNGATKNEKKIVQRCAKHGEFSNFFCLGCFAEEKSRVVSN
jgi:hypothetical protein